MFYTLLDTQLHAELQNIFVNFDRALNDSCKAQDAIDDSSSFVIVSNLVRRDSSLHSRIAFSRKEIALVAKYDPHAWNKWPEVKPPVNVWMRLETDRGLGFKARLNDLGIWVDGKSRAFFYDVGEFVRFRPWED